MYADMCLRIYILLERRERKERMKVKAPQSKIYEVKKENRNGKAYPTVQYNPRYSQTL